MAISASSSPFRPRLVLLRDPRDGRTTRMSLTAHHDRFWIDLDSGDADDGGRAVDRWHATEAEAVKDFEFLLHSYQHAGYQIFSDKRESPARMGLSSPKAFAPKQN